MMDLYKILGIDNNATPEDIKQAYRKAAQLNHPDKGGDTELFQQIKTAYEVLSDTERRQQYDQTGNIELHNIKQLAQNELAGLFEHFLDNYLINSHKSLLEMIKKEVTQTMLNTRTDIQKLKEKQQKLNSVINKVTTKNSINLFKNIVDQRLLEITSQLENQKMHEEILNEITSILKSYTEEITEQQHEELWVLPNNFYASTQQF